MLTFMLKKAADGQFALENKGQDKVAKVYLERSQNTVYLLSPDDRIEGYFTFDENRKTFLCFSESKLVSKLECFHDVIASFPGQFLKGGKLRTAKDPDNRYHLIDDSSTERITCEEKDSAYCFTLYPETMDGCLILLLTSLAFCFENYLLS